MKEIKGGVQQTGTFFLVLLGTLFYNLSVMVIGWMMNALMDDKLGAFELHSF